MNEQAICSCLIGYMGAPPSCRPECLVDSDCTSLMACSNQKCINPCQGSCGLNAECRVHNHIPICYCRSGFTGDPFSQCTLIQSKFFYDFWQYTNLNCLFFTRLPKKESNVFRVHGCMYASILFHHNFYMPRQNLIYESLHHPEWLATNYYF